MKRASIVRSAAVSGVSLLVLAALGLFHLNSQRGAVGQSIPDEQVTDKVEAVDVPQTAESTPAAAADKAADGVARGKAWAEFAILHPKEYYAEFLKIRTKAEADAEAEAQFAIEKPAEHASTFAAQRSPDRIRAEEEALFAILHPEEHYAQVVSRRSPEEVEAAAKASFAIQYPGQPMEVPTDSDSTLGR